MTLSHQPCVLSRLTAADEQGRRRRRICDLEVKILREAAATVKAQ